MQYCPCFQKYRQPALTDDILRRDKEIVKQKTTVDFADSTVLLTKKN